ncbi:E3 ubiquitin/ISG15 ligase TRIM25 [Esox lucius]|uniref:Uncharacterized protein n=1 Tax=Esox lucius TaxID=8010 RepID=A0AAY5KNR8_ESOLU|nr:E3 ubiquitin/ISG15 ligase TRIM25 [Esox lucius]
MTLLFEGILTDIEKYLTCSICFEIFTDPGTLSCGHSYCMKCLDDYFSKIAKKKRCCPECRETIREPLKRSKSVILCNIVKVYKKHKDFSEGHDTEVAKQFDIDYMSAEVSNIRCPDVPGPLDSTVQELSVSPLSNDRPRSKEFSRPAHSLPTFSFCLLTFNQALGNKRLEFLLKDRKVVTKKASSASHHDRFDICQWMAEEEISTGCHYWDVDTSGSVGWAVGVAYPSIGHRDQLGRTANSWCLEWSQDKLCYWHNNVKEFMKHDCPSMVRVALDMTNGTLSFYSLTESQNLLHSVMERFSEAVRPVFWLFGLKQPNALFFPPLPT